MENLHIQLILCLLLSAFTSVCFGISFCYKPTCDDSQIQVNCTTSGASSSAECKFSYWGSSNYFPESRVKTETRRQSDGNYQVNCICSLRIGDLVIGREYYLYAKVNAETINVTMPVYFLPLSLKNILDFNKTYDGFLDSATKSISVNIVGCPGPNDYWLKMKNKTVVNETEWVDVPEDQYEIEISYSQSVYKNLSVHAVKLKFVDDRAIQATQYILIMSNGINPPLVFPFSLDESFTDDFPVLAVALGVGAAGIVILGVAAYCIYRNFFQ